MHTIKLATLTVTALLGFSGAAVTANALPQDATSPAPQQVSLPNDDIDPATAEELSRILERERLASDLYAALSEKHSQNHVLLVAAKLGKHNLTAAGRLLATSDIADPAAGLKAGDYAYDDLDDLYEESLATGKSSLVDAFKAGIELEKAEITKLDGLLADMTDHKAKRVLRRLLHAAKLDVRLFTAAAAHPDDMIMPPLPEDWPNLPEDLPEMPEDWPDLPAGWPDLREDWPQLREDWAKLREDWPGLQEEWANFREDWSQARDRFNREHWRDLRPPRSGVGHCQDHDG